MMPREGTMIADRYRLERKVGGGRVAAMWLVRDQVTESACAVKVLHRSMNEHPEALARFSLEDRLARELTGVYFPERVGSGSWQSMRYIAWRWYEGECLRALFDRNPKQDVQTVNSIAQETCNALSMVHGAGYTHGDLKPENLFFAERAEKDKEASRQLKLLGFGVASRLARPLLGAQGRRTPGQFVGTPLYLSPELILGRVPRGGQADLWALAVIVYEALTGRVPFLGDDLSGVLGAILEKQAPKPSSIAEKLPGSFDLWWAQALEQGFATPAEFATSLSRALAPALRSSRTQRSASFPTSASSLGDAVVGTTRNVSVASSASPPHTAGSAPVQSAPVQSAPVQSAIPRAATSRATAAKQARSAAAVPATAGSAAKLSRPAPGPVVDAASTSAAAGSAPSSSPVNAIGPADGVVPAPQPPAASSAAAASALTAATAEASPAGEATLTGAAAETAHATPSSAATVAPVAGAKAAPDVGGTTSLGIAPLGSVSAGSVSAGSVSAGSVSAGSVSKSPGAAPSGGAHATLSNGISNAVLFREAVAAATDPRRPGAASPPRPHSAASGRREQAAPSLAALSSAASPPAAPSQADASHEAPAQPLSLGSSTAPGIGPAAVAMIRALQSAAADAAASIRGVGPRTGSFSPLPSPLSDFASTGSRKTLVGITPPAHAAAALRSSTGTASVAPGASAVAAARAAPSGLDVSAIEGAPCRPIEVSEEESAAEAAYFNNPLRRAGHPTVPFARPRAARRSAAHDTVPNEILPDLERAFEMDASQGSAPWTMRTTRTLRLVLTDSGHRPHLVAGLLVCGAAALVIFALGHSPMAGTGMLGQSTQSLEPPAAPLPSASASAAAGPSSAPHPIQEPSAEPQLAADGPASAEAPAPAPGSGDAAPPPAPNAPARLAVKELAPGLIVPAHPPLPPPAHPKPEKPKAPQTSPPLRVGPTGAPSPAPSPTTHLPNSQKPPSTEPLGAAARPAPVKPGAKKPESDAPRPAHGDFDFGI